MSASRRAFLKAGAIGGAALFLRVPLLEAKAGAAGESRFQPRQSLERFVKIRGGKTHAG